MTKTRRPTLLRLDWEPCTRSRWNQTTEPAGTSTGIASPSSSSAPYCLGVKTPAALVAQALRLGLLD